MRRLLAIVLVLFMTLPGCGSTFTTPPEMPSNFVVGMRSKEQLEPPVDFMIKVDRSGGAKWETTVRAPTRRAFKGELELTEAQIRELYDLVLSADYQNMAPTYKAEQGSSNRAENGNRIFWVEALGLDHRVDIDYMSIPQIQPLHDKLLSLIPKYAITGVGGPGDDLPPADRLVADRTTRRFHHPDCEQAQDISPDDREAFRRWEDALNFKYDPCPICKPMEER